MKSFLEYLPHVLASVTVIGLATSATTHIVLRKNDVRAAVGWIGLVWLSPIVGVVLYTLFGINRIRRRATALTRDRPEFNNPDPAMIVEPERLPELFGEEQRHLVSLARVGRANLKRPLLDGNVVEPLFNGDEAYPAMLQAIESAKTSITLSSYIFDNDEVGRQFVDCLAAAKDRGVEVRVLVDAAGARYSFPTIVTLLRRKGVKVARFLPSSLIPPFILSFNLRNHRKILVVDGATGFTGGMNIRELCVLAGEPKLPTRDLHFRIRGPVVRQLQEVFSEDWAFSAREHLEGETWFVAQEQYGSVIARGITDGPDGDLDKLRWSMLGAINAATSSIRIVTPYFLPDEAILEALIVARMRGVRVDVVMPARNNLPYVAWACMGQMGDLLRHEIDIWFVEGDFDHSKLCVVDRAWALIGSPNWDPRSLRLNFEFALECFDSTFAAQMSEWIAGRIARSKKWTIDDFRSRSMLVKMRDGIARLLSPYL